MAVIKRTVRVESEARMPMYHSNIHDAHGVVYNEEGSGLPNIAAATVEAVTSAQKLWLMLSGMACWTLSGGLK